VIKLHQHGARPPQGPGHYSEDGRRWYDDAGRRWLPVIEGQDTLVVELEDVAAAAWAPAVLGPLFSHVGHAHSWFVGHATSIDPRWRTYEITSATFPRVHGVLDDVLPREAWTPGMAEALEELRRRLEAEGWLPAGHGGREWTYRYVRPSVAWPVDDGGASREELPDPPVDPARG
jgi:hypothetical protein